MDRPESSNTDADLVKLASEMEQELRGIRRAMRLPFEAEIAKGGLTAPQISVMREIVRHEGINLRDLSRAVSLAHSTVSGIVDRLQKRGILERRPDPQDGRVSCIHPTAAVQEFVRDRIPALTRGPLLDALGRATDAERTNMRIALRRLRELLEKT